MRDTSVVKPALAVGVITLAAVWLGPLPRLAAHSFSAQMTMHMGVVAIAAPLLAVAIAGSRWDPGCARPLLFSAVPAAILELVVVWAWHAPALHHAARSTTMGLVAEQSTFLAAGLLVWLSALGGDVPRSGSRAAAGILALLLTSMHMTLLGALLALSPRALYVHAGPAGFALEEQHLGGVIMLIVGGASYMAGALWLTIRMLRDAGPARSTTAHGDVQPGRRSA
jgi:putative membrane protein